MQRRLYFLSLLVISALFLMGCSPEVSASTQPAEVNVDGGQVEEPSAEEGVQLPEGDADSFATATAAAAMIETSTAGFAQTATAEAGGGEQPAEDQPAEEQPQEGENQDQPQEEAQPEATEAPPEPTAAPEPTATPEPVAVSDCSSPYTVSQGEWFWSIGRKCNIHPDDIMAANNANSSTILYPGDVLVLPANARSFPGP